VSDDQILILSSLHSLSKQLFFGGELLFSLARKLPGGTHLDLNVINKFFNFLKKKFVILVKQNFFIYSKYYVKVVNDNFYVIIN
jgi:hypothetical protein